MKKMATLVGVSVIALFLMVVMASAGPAIPYGIKGVYKVTGFSSCDPTSPGIMEATYIFNNDGTGSAFGNGRRITATEGLSDDFQLDFHYTVTKEGYIEFQYPFPPGGIRVGYYDDQEVFHAVMTMDGAMSHGYISPDGKTITIQCGPPVSLNGINPETGAFLFGPVWCVTSVAGMRIK